MGRRVGAAGRSGRRKPARRLSRERGARRAAYSFRHFYISQQLITGVDVFVLAKDTGTSGGMIERFYGKVELDRMARELRPEWRSRGDGRVPDG